MNRTALNRTAEDDAIAMSPIEAVLYRDAVTAELTRLLESAAYCARQRHGVVYLIVDRTADPAEAEIKAYFGSGRLVDLWDLDPLLWDDAHWAALRLVPEGHAEIVRAELHRG